MYLDFLKERISTVSILFLYGLVKGAIEKYNCILILLQRFHNKKGCGLI